MRKREIRTVASLMMALALFLSLIAPAAAASGGHWAEETLAAWKEAGWLTGDGNGNLRPDDSVTRAEFAALINRSFGLGQTPGSASFKDLSESDWAYGDIQTAVAEGYLQGNGDGSVRPHAPITREEAAVIIARLLGLESGGADVQYKDRDAIAGWSIGAVAAVSREGIFNGLPDGSFRPKATLTRAEAAVSLERAQEAAGLGTIYPKAGTFGPESGTETIEGNVTVMAAGVTLRNLHITGDLVIAASVGEGDVYLDGVTVDGNAIVRGGGENSIHLTNTVIVNVVLDKKTGTVRLVAQGNTVIREVEVRSPSIIHASGLSGGGISTVKLARELPENSRVELRGNIENVSVSAKLIHVVVPEGSIVSLEVAQDADEVDIELAQEAAIVELILNAVAKVIGVGEIGKAVVNAEGVSFDQAPKAIEIGEDLPEDAEVVIGGETKTAGEVQTPSQPSQTEQGSSAPSSPSGPSQGGGQQSEVVLEFSPGLLGDWDGVIRVETVHLAMIRDNQPVPISPPVQNGGKWHTTIGGVTYQISVYGGDEAIALDSINYLGDSYVTFNARDYSFSGRQTFRVVLTPTGSGAKTIEAQKEFPERPVMIWPDDEDRNPGIDGRDFNLGWIPSGRPEVSSTKLYIIPAPNGAFIFEPSDWEPVAEFDDVDPVQIWKGTENQKDSGGNPFKPRQYYYIYVAEFVEGEDHPDTNSLLYAPVVDLMMDYTNGPQLTIEPSDDDPAPVVYVTSDKSLDIQDKDTRYATVGDIVYGWSDTDGYLYLVPSSFGYQTVADLEAMVQNGRGLRVPVEANQGVDLDTRWMEIEEYVLYGVSEKNKIGKSDDYSGIRLFADATEPLKNLISFAYDFEGFESIVEYQFNKEIINNLATLEDFAEALRIRDERTGQEQSLSKDNLKEWDRWRLILDLPEWLDKEYITLIIPAGTVKDRFGQVNGTDIETDPVVLKPILTVESDDHLGANDYKKDGTLTLTASKDVPHLYLALLTEGIFGTFLSDQAVEAGRAKKISLVGGAAAELSLKDLAPGEYHLFAVYVLREGYYSYHYFDIINIVEE